MAAGFLCSAADLELSTPRSMIQDPVWHHSEWNTNIPLFSSTMGPKTQTHQTLFAQPHNAWKSTSPEDWLLGKMRGEDNPHVLGGLMLMKPVGGEETTGQPQTEPEEEL